MGLDVAPYRVGRDRLSAGYNGPVPSPALWIIFDCAISLAAIHHAVNGLSPGLNDPMCSMLVVSEHQAVEFGRFPTREFEGDRDDLRAGPKFPVQFGAEALHDMGDPEQGDDVVA